ncbi:MAG: hypothetical protein LBM96_10380 [Methanobrevibacter sp.]|jgi:predicted outer membrane repeat protein|nr:hypothetical protein [Candidatus Methanoflexus mossambicus]
MNKKIFFNSLIILSLLFLTITAISSVCGAIDTNSNGIDEKNTINSVYDNNSLDNNLILGKNDISASNLILNITITTNDNLNNAINILNKNANGSSLTKKYSNLKLMPGIYNKSEDLNNILNVNNADITISSSSPNEKATIDGNNSKGIFSINGINSNIRFININFINANVNPAIKNYHDGGAIFNLNTNLSFINCSFINNKGVNGAGIHSINGTLVINNCNFSNNIASKNGGAIFNNITNLKRIVPPTFLFMIDNSNFNNNTASNFGGAIYSDIISSKNYKFNITKTNFTYNNAKSGSAIAFIDKLCNVYNFNYCNFSFNAGENEIYIHTIESLKTHNSYCLSFLNSVFNLNNHTLANIYNDGSSIQVLLKNITRIENDFVLIDSSKGASNNIEMIDVSNIRIYDVYVFTSGKQIGNQYIFTAKIFNLNTAKYITDLTLPLYLIINENNKVEIKFINGEAKYIYDISKTGFLNINLQFEGYRYLQKTPNPVTVIYNSFNSFFAKKVTSPIKSTIISFKVTKPNVYGKITYTAILKTKDNKLLNGKRVYFYYDNKKIGSKRTVKGIAKFTYTLQSFGKKSIAVCFNGDSAYKKVYSSKKLTNYVIFLSNKVKHYGKSVSINSKVYNYYPTTKTFKITFKIPKGLTISKYTLPKTSKKFIDKFKIGYDKNRRYLYYVFTGFKKFKSISNIVFIINSKKKGTYKIKNSINNHLTLISDSKLLKIKI